MIMTKTGCRTVVRAVCMLAVLAGAGCRGRSTSEPSKPRAQTPAPIPPRGSVSLDKNNYPVFPDADAGADPSVPADQGGRGFIGQGWQTSTDVDLLGDRRAVKGDG